MSSILECSSSLPSHQYISLFLYSFPYLILHIRSEKASIERSQFFFPIYFISALMVFSNDPLVPHIISRRFEIDILVANLGFACLSIRNLWRIRYIPTPDLGWQDSRRYFVAYLQIPELVRGSEKTRVHARNILLRFVLRRFWPEEYILKIGIGGSSMWTFPIASESFRFIREFHISSEFQIVSS